MDHTGGNEMTKTKTISYGYVELLDYYKKHINEQLIPFWNRAEDREQGGIFTCFNNEGDILLSKNKYTWSQGRFVWIWSKLYEMIDKGLIEGNKEAYMKQIEKTVEFLDKNVFMEDGKCCYLLSENGQKLEEVPGEGYDSSFFSDCFVMLGFAEYGRITGNISRVEKAADIYTHVEQLLSIRDVRCEPYPVPDELDSHSFYMIMLDMTRQMYDSFLAFDDPRAELFAIKMQQYIDLIMDKFCDENLLIREMIARVPEDNSYNKLLLVNHINPGHSIECMWFVIVAADRLGLTDKKLKAFQIIKNTYQVGWDKELGGLLRYVNVDGQKPAGDLLGTKFEKLIQNTWDMKLWWPHSEALFCTMLAYDLTQDDEFFELYKKTHDYTFGTFPNENTEIGEWIQIRKQDGTPSNTIVALPVKDPYHILRNFVMMIELLNDKK
jgi:N-acylglucosamine 2-epimerase